MKLVSALGTKLGAQAGALRVVALAALASCLDHKPSYLLPFRSSTLSEITSIYSP